MSPLFMLLFNTNCMMLFGMRKAFLLLYEIAIKNGFKDESEKLV